MQKMIKSDLVKGGEISNRNPEKQRGRSLLKVKLNLHINMKNKELINTGRERRLNSEGESSHKSLKKKNVFQMLHMLNFLFTSQRRESVSQQIHHGSYDWQICCSQNQNQQQLCRVLLPAPGRTLTSGYRFIKLLLLFTRTGSCWQNLAKIIYFLRCTQ